MNSGCCESTPAESGAKRDQYRWDHPKGDDEYMSERAGLGHWEEFELDNFSDKTKEILARMGIESGTSCHWHSPEELEEAGVTRRDMREIEHYHHGRWEKWPKPEPVEEKPLTVLQQISKHFETTFIENAEKTVFGQFMLYTLTCQLIRLDEHPQTRSFVCTFIDSEETHTQEIKVSDLQDFPVFWRMLFATEEVRRLLTQPNVEQVV